MANPSITAWLRPLAGLFALTAIFALSACGGGSGAPNNPYAPKPTAPSALMVLPAAISVYPGVPASLTISGGTPPYQAFSSNSAVLPIAQSVASATITLAANPIASDADVAVAVTIKDSTAQTVAASVTVKASPLLGTISVLPSSPDCGSNLCTGESGSASVTARLPSGGPAVGMLVRFDVVYGAYALMSTNPATPLVQTLTVVTDSTGKATVRVQATASASTQPAQIRATAVDGGQQLIGNFTITNRIASSEIKVVPDTATIQSAYVNECSIGFRVDYFIYGGTPPYRVSPSFPTGVSIVGSPVATSGGFFEAVTTGICVDPLTFTIVDASGKQTTATLSNLAGTATLPGPTPAPDFSITPESLGSVSCTGRSFRFTLVGGTAPYNVTSSIPGTVLSPAVVNSSGGTTTVSGLLDTGGRAVITAVDSTSPQKKVSATIDCLAGASSAPPLVITPGSIDSRFCTGSTFQFAASGGTPPYAVVSSTASTGINPASIPVSGGVTQISGLTTGSGSTTLSFLDSGSPKQSVTATVSCTPSPPALQVTPSSVSNIACTGKSFQFVVTGGTPPYNVYSSSTLATLTPSIIAASGGTTVVGGLTTGLGSSAPVTIVFVDSNVPQFTTSATITCP
jgi:hypothetical protein